MMTTLKVSLGPIQPVVHSVNVLVDDSGAYLLINYYAGTPSKIVVPQPKTVGDLVEVMKEKNKVQR